eukprot:CAMPEP_0206238034 /NCGR_PEP_ID=MMETSP0047_2-20121206/14596_1 /ASSEMBLY_ACC=CAM_ASM_000192 /TAXON_ID=195065 /ORGANISM="Chroomonas mesostigmatica_cf, Strain CCMP1168" /LENGTH=108 /DNA_ID=CAMNT_0053662535 /DNA_START=273 /DNA_END=596 /DNA_ORIENTATION=+
MKWRPSRARASACAMCLRRKRRPREHVPSLKWREHVHQWAMCWRQKRSLIKCPPSCGDPREHVYPLGPVVGDKDAPPRINGQPERLCKLDPAAPLLVDRPQVPPLPAE